MCDKYSMPLEEVLWQVASALLGILFIISEVIGKSKCQYNGVFEFLIGNVLTRITCINTGTEEEDVPIPAIVQTTPKE